MCTPAGQRNASILLLVVLELLHSLQQDEEISLVIEWALLLFKET